MDVAWAVDKASMITLGGADGIIYQNTIYDNPELGAQLVYENLRVVTLFPTGNHRRMVMPLYGGSVVQIWGGDEPVLRLI